MPFIEGRIRLLPGSQWADLRVKGFRSTYHQLRVLRCCIGNHFVPEPARWSWQKWSPIRRRRGGVGLVECRLIGQRSSLGTQMVMLPTGHCPSTWVHLLVDHSVITHLPQAQYHLQAQIPTL